MILSIHSFVGSFIYLFISLFLILILKSLSETLSGVSVCMYLWTTEQNSNKCMAVIVSIKASNKCKFHYLTVSAKLIFSYFHSSNYPSKVIRMLPVHLPPRREHPKN